MPVLTFLPIARFDFCRGSVEFTDGTNSEKARGRAMEESKIAATDRLRREGRWEEASLYKDKIRTELKAKGIPRKEANEESWKKMAETFPPQDGEQDELASRSAFGTVDVARDAGWVYRHLDPSIETEDAPSSGALGLLRWARSNPRAFLKTFFPQSANSTSGAPSWSPFASSDSGTDGAENRPPSLADIRKANEAQRLRRFKS